MERRRDWLTVENLGFFLVLSGIAVILIGHLMEYGALSLRQLFLDAYANAGSEMLSIAVTILIIDGLYRRREAAAYRDQLIRQMSSKDGSTALRAVDELRSLGHLTNGTLQHADLKYGNLAGAILSSADLRAAYLSFANLNGADLRDANLQEAILRNADLRDALLLNANLTNAKLLEADLSGANLHGAALAGANLAGANLLGARGVTEEMIAQAATLAGAILPNGSRHAG